MNTFAQILLFYGLVTVMFGCIATIFYLMLQSHERRVPARIIITCWAWPIWLMLALKHFAPQVWADAKNDQ